MNKRQIKKLKDIINYDAENPEHKRLLRRLKKSYKDLPSNKKVNLLEDLRKAFKVD